MGVSGAARAEPRCAHALTQRCAQPASALPTRLAAGSLRPDGPNVVQLLQVRLARALPPACCELNALSSRRARCRKA